MDVSASSTTDSVQNIAAPIPSGDNSSSREIRPRGGRDSNRQRRGMRGAGRWGSGRKPGGPRGERAEVPVGSDYEEKNLEVTRVTRVTKGGKRMRFRSLTVIGNRKGRVGFGIAKGADVAVATNKAATQARKSLLSVLMVRETIPHVVEAKYKAAHVLLKPAPRGTGLKAGGAIRVVLELAGIPNVVSKMLGSSNKINNVKATCAALKKLHLPIAAVIAEEKEEPKTRTFII